MNKTKNKINLILEKFYNGEKYKALNEITLIINSNDKDKELLLIQAKMFFNLNQSTNGLNSLFKILNFEPKNKTVLKIIYSNFIKINDFKNAEIYIDRFLKIDNLKYEVLRDKAFILYLKKNFIKSEEFIIKARKINDKDVFGINIFGLIKLEQNKSLEAMKLFNKAISIDPNYTDSYNNLGQIF